MPGQMRNRRFIDAASRVDIHGVGYFVGGLRNALSLMLRLILARRREQKTAIRCECQTAEKGRQRLVGV